MEKKYFTSVLGQKIHSLKESLVKSSESIAKNYTVRSDAYINENDFCLAYITSFKNLQDSPIELTIDVTFTSDTVILEANVVTSDGDFIEDLGIEKIPWGDANDTLLALDEYFEQFAEKKLPIYLKFILSQ